MHKDSAVSQLPIAAPGNAANQVATTQPKPLGSKAKAAIVVRLLMNEGADLPLEDLPDELQGRLIQQMGTMGLVDRDTLTTVIDEFATKLDGIGLSFPNGLAEALSEMDGKISPQTAARLRKEAGVRQAGHPWSRLRALPVPDLVAMAKAESIEVAAVLLSKLDTAKAAAMLGGLPGPLARRITYAVSQTGQVTPDAVDRIGLSLASQLDDKPNVAFADDPGARIGAILNQSAATIRNDMLTGLDETDTDFASAVRKSIFTFAHIPARILARDVPKIIKAIDPEVLVTALAAATDEETAPAAEYLLGNMSSRMADSLREEMQEKGKVKIRDGEVAMTEVIAAIRAQEQAGELTLVVPESEEDDAED
ncbi:flagellar motor switch protein FliG [Sedimentitalea nanhaiensis]|uniref:Flagellar motor switch protein FliG n=1 Tax=Sedimentitalea nanhaiensis TaxID=999627 RepID=A0A1I6ZVJ4_9RHOB|nr:FliG C-terminal domain-containing protein [Sedimentitalea nanhaiensis]SFT66703.1 flagellar motor switch protein FliG [Sedimentitalea nanhaiensis]